MRLSPQQQYMELPYLVQTSSGDVLTLHCLAGRFLVSYMITYLPALKRAANRDQLDRAIHNGRVSTM